MAKMKRSMRPENANSGIPKEESLDELLYDEVLSPDTSWDMSDVKDYMTRKVAPPAPYTTETPNEQ